MELSAVLSKVQKLINLAEHPNTGEEEASLARTQADALMLKFAIDSAMLDQARPAAEQLRPTVGTFLLTGDSALDGYVAGMARDVAAYCRCRVRNYTGREDGCWQGRVYGYESDVRYFEVLYTCLRLHMADALRPKVDASLTLEENAYRLHNAGFNWREIARQFGWRKATSWEAEGYDFPEAWIKDGEVLWVRTVARKFNLAYQRAARDHGTEKLKVPASASETWRTSAASGYISRLYTRLQDQASKREISGALVLRADAVEDALREDNAEDFTRCPKCLKLSASPYDCDRCGHHMADRPEVQECPRCKAAASGYCRDHKPRAYRPRARSDAGWAAGVAQANAADLMAGRSTDAQAARQLG